MADRDADWLHCVAPWAAPEASALETFAVAEQKTGVRTICIADEVAKAVGLPGALSFMLDQGFSAGWCGEVLGCVEERPPGPERMTVEACPGELTSHADLEQLLRCRIGEAREIDIDPIDPDGWRSSAAFRWLGLAGRQQHAVQVAWRRGLFTTLVRVETERGALLVGLTSREPSPARGRLATALASFVLGEEALRPHRAFLRQGGVEIPLLEGREPMLGSAAHCAIFVPGPSEWAQLVLRHGRWHIRAVEPSSQLVPVLVNGERVTELARGLSSGDSIGDGETSIRFQDQVYTGIDPVPEAAEAAPLWHAARRPLVVPSLGQPDSGDISTPALPPPPARRLFVPGDDPTFVRLSLSRPFSLPGEGLTASTVGKQLRLTGARTALTLQPWGDDPDWEALNAFLDDHYLAGGTRWRRVLRPLSSPSRHGQPCRLMIERHTHMAVLVDRGDDASLVALVVPPDAAAMLMIIQSCAHVGHGIAVPRDPILKRAIDGWRWESGPTG